MSQLVANKIRPVLLITAALLFAAACADDATRIERAKAFQAEGEYRAAVIELKNVLRSDAENSEARALLGQISLLNGDTATAIKELQRSRELGAQSDDYLVPLARALIREARYPEVIKLNPQSLSDPENQAALLAIMGNAELSRGDQREAENNFDAALKVVPGQADALIGKARLAQDRGNFKQAEDQLKQMLISRPNDPDGLGALAQVQFRNGEFAAAEENYIKAIAAVEKTGRMLERMTFTGALIETYLSQNKNTEAQMLANKMMSQTSQHPMSLFLAARADYAAKDFDGAIEKAERIVTTNATAEPPRMLLAAAALAKGNTALAATHLQATVNINPANEMARKLLAQVRMQMGDPEEALALLEPLIAAGSTDSQLMAMVSTATIRTGDTDAGVAMIEKSIAEGNSDPAVLLQAAANFLASGEINRAIEVLESLPEAQQVGQKDLLLVLALLKKGDEDAARERVMSVVERSPDSADAQRLLGSFHLAVKEPEKARTAFESALRIDPDNVASMMNLVSIDISENKPDQAEARLQSYLERKPGDLSTLTALARLAEKAGDLEKGVALLEQAREANPASLAPALTLAQYYMRSGNTELARERANQAMRIDESSGGAQLVLGMILLKDEQPSQAVPYFEKAIELSPKSAVALYQLGRAQAATGMADASTKSYRKAIEVDPSYFPALAALVGADVDRGDLNSALQVAEQLLQAYPENSEPHILKADVHVARKEYTAALQALDDAAALKESRLIAGKRFDIRRKMGASEPWTELQDWLADHPDDTKIRLGLAQAYMQAGKTDLAIQNYEQVMEMAPNVDVASVLAMAHSSGGNYDAAASWLEKANMIKPGDMALQAALAGIEAKRGNIDTAVAKVRQLRRDFPDAEQLYALEGEILLAAKDYKGSIQALDRALESDPSAGLVVRRFNAGKGDGDEEAWRILENWYSKNPKDDLVGVQLAQEYSSREWHDEAIDVYQTMLENNPDNFVTQNNIAWSYMTRGNAGDLKMALNSAASAYQQRPDIAAIADTYGWILLQDGQNKKAVEILQPAAQGSKADPEILYHYAAALDANDRDSEALKIVNRALASDATFASRDDAEILQRRLSE